MAYMSQDKKKELAPKIKAIFKKYNVKGSIGVENHSTLRVTIREGYLDLIGNVIETIKAKPLRGDYFEEERRAENLKYIESKQYFDVNHYHYEKSFTGKPLKLIKELLEVMNDGNWDKSDLMTDYFNVGWYVDLKIGTWEKPYRFVELKKVTK